MSLGEGNCIAWKGGAWNAVISSHRTSSSRKSEARSALVESSRALVFQEAMVPGELAKIFHRRERLLVQHGGSSSKTLHAKMNKILEGKDRQAVLFDYHTVETAVGRHRSHVPRSSRPSVSNSKLWSRVQCHCQPSKCHQCNWINECFPLVVPCPRRQNVKNSKSSRKCKRIRA